MKWITGPDSMHETGYSGLVHWDEDGMGREAGGGFWMGNRCAPVADSCLAKVTAIL